MSSNPTPSATCAKTISPPPIPPPFFRPSSPPLLRLMQINCWQQKRRIGEIYTEEANCVGKSDAGKKISRNVERKPVVFYGRRRCCFAAADIYCVFSSCGGGQDTSQQRPMLSRKKAKKKKKKIVKKGEDPLLLESLFCPLCFLGGGKGAWGGQ